MGLAPDLPTGAEQPGASGALRDALREIRRLRSELTRAQRPGAAPVAVVGIGCRFPGDVASPKAYWRLLENGQCAISPFPEGRWDRHAWFDPDPDAPGRIYTQHGGYLSQIEAFDPEPFGISPREAKGLDPQQRLLLEVTWEALERAGLSSPALQGSDTGVYIGMSTDDYGDLSSSAHGSIDAWNGLGTMRSVAAGRIAYTFGLQGPAIVSDTSCSSSLIALHQACQDLHAGTISAAIAGGVNLILDPRSTIKLCRLRALSPDGLCRTFDAAANGYVRGEGCGIVVLKTLAQAEQDNDDILAVIRATAINHDGQSNGLTAPNGQAQVRLLQAALDQGSLDPGQIQYLEAHGTGTALGDPIEVQALGQVYGRDRSPQHALRIGSVKTNIGHLEAAAGMAGFIKAVVSMQHGQFAPHLHFTEPNPYVDWANLPITVPVTGEIWHRPANDRRRAAVSAFGMSGTNAHVILEEYDAPVRASDPQLPPQTSAWDLLGLSAQSDAALDDLARSHLKLLQETGNPALDALCHTANTRRLPLERRAALVADSHDGLRSALTAFLDPNGPAPGRGDSSPVVRAPAAISASPSVGFLFSGQGSHYRHMGRGLDKTQPVFRETLNRCDACLHDALGQSIRTLIDDDSGLLNQTRYTQPVLYSLQCALYRLWESIGVRPHAVMGHSVGEFAAAFAAGVFTLEQGMKLVMERARLMQSMPENGSMVAVLGPEEITEKHVTQTAGLVEIAAYNGPGHLVLSGDGQVLREVITELEPQGLTCLPLDVSHAFHSAHMEGMLDELESTAREMDFGDPSVPLISNLTGRAVEPGQIDASYWSSHVRRAVRFREGMQAMSEANCEVFVEIGPGDILTGMGRRVLSSPRDSWSASLRRGVPDARQFRLAAGELFVRHVAIDFDALDGHRAPGRCQLPTYPFKRRRFWLESETDKAVATPDPQATPDVEKLLYTTRWLPLRRLERIDSTTFQAPKQVLAAIRPIFDDRAQQKNIDGIRRRHAMLDPACLRHALEAWRALDLPRNRGDNISLCDITTRAGFDGSRLPILHSVVGILSRHQLLTATGDDLEILDDLPTDTQSAHPTDGLEAEAALLDRCGTNLAAVLRGEIDPVELLFPQGDLAHVERLYETSVESALVNEMIAASIKHLARTGEGRVRILEIGAGTGGTTSRVLSALEDVDYDYVYTDVSSAFLKPASLKFSGFEGINFRTLDIETPPGSQDFRADSFDVVIASNVIHATRDLHVALGHVQELLAPGGLFLLNEVTGRAGWLELTFGLLDGWWRFDDPGRRTWGPLLSRDAWTTTLADCGFEAPASWTAGGRQAPNRFEQSLILTRKSADAPLSDVRPWLLFLDATAAASNLTDRFEQSGAECCRVLPGHDFEQLSDLNFRINPTDPDHVQRLFQRVPGPLQGIVHLWNLDATPFDATDADGLLADAALGCASLLHLSQHLAVEGSDLTTWVVTRGAAGLPQDDTIEPVMSVSWGLGKVIGQEHPELDVRFIDLDPSDHDVVGQVADYLLHDEPCSEAEVAIREDVVLAPRLAPYAQPAAEGATIRPDATYLVTGGLGAVGLEVAGWMVSRGATSIVLMGRSAPQQDVLDRLESWRREQVEVVVFQGDVSSERDVERLGKALAAQDKPLRGVLHAAGVTDDRLLREHEWHLFEKVLQAKMIGSWNLQVLTAGTQLDFFICFSSIASMTGGAGLGTYVAANAFADAFAAYRRHRNEPAHAVCWGPWDGLGMTQRVSTMRRAQWQAMGVSPVDATSCLRALGLVLASDQDRIGVVDADWQRFVGRFTDPRRIGQFCLLNEGSGTDVTTGGLLASLTAADAASRRELVVEQLRGLVAQVLGRENATQIPADRGLFDLGMDSLMALEFTRHINASYGSTLSNTVVFRYPTVADLGTHLLEEISTLETPQPPVPGLKSAPVEVTTTAASRGPIEETDAIAIISMACRFPGNADTPEAFWDLLSRGVDTIAPYPKQRWDIDAYYDPDPDAAGGISAREGGFLDSIDQFDPTFFGISPTEATSMDPQQRLLLEVCWEAMERAGIAPSSLSESPTGVFVGIGQNDYSRWKLSAGDLDAINAYDGTGNGFSFSAGRISYTLGLQGPSLAVDTACSSSLVALHLACQSLRSGECSSALAGGVHLNLSPEVSFFLSRAGALAPDGRCKAFDAAADGFGRGEGTGVVLLKRLADATAAGDPVLAIVRSTAVNHDGSSSGLTVPNQRAQDSLLETALRQARVQASEVGFVEAHGTGTRLGDPIEVESLGRVYGEDRSSSHPLYIGSVKSNLGHLEAASGMAGLIKTVLALQHGSIPPHLHFTQPNPHIAWDEIPVRVASTLTAWPSEHRIAGVSSFGMSGTNAHVIVEQAPAVETHELRSPEVTRNLLVLSARSEQALRDLALRSVDALEGDANIDLFDFCVSAALGRDHLSQRLAVIGSSAVDLCRKLRAVFDTPPPAHVLRNGTAPGDVSDPLRAVAERYVAGHTVDWTGVYPHRARRPDRLPTYPFQRQRYWVEGSPFAGSAPDTASAGAKDERLADASCYTLDWQAVDLPNLPQRSAAPDTWVVIGCADDRGDELIALMRDAGAQAILCSEDETPHSIDLGRQLQGLAELPVHVGVVDLRHTGGPRPVEQGTDAEAPATELASITSDRCVELLHLAQALPQAGVQDCRLWIVTRGAIAVGQNQRLSDLPGSVLWGFGRSLALELPRHWGGLVDLDAIESPQSGVERLWTVLSRQITEGQLAIRDGTWHAPRVEPLAAVQMTPNPVSIRHDASYVISGGLGALGLQTANWLADQGARHLLLFSRRRPGEAATAALRELDRRGLQTTVLSADVSKESDMQAVRKQLAALPPVRGVVHAAGVPGVKSVDKLDPETLRSTMAPKVAGTLLLAGLVDGEDLDFFILYSSVAALWGSKHQTHYAAASSFLDAYAADRRACGLPATSVWWGPWDGDGMVTHDDRVALKQMGLSMLTGDRLPSALEHAIGVDHQLAVADIDWTRLAPLFEGAGISGLLDSVSKRPAVRTGKGGLSWDEVAPEAERPARLRLFVGRLVSQLMGWAEQDGPDPDQGLFELGMDSIMAVSLKSALEHQLPVELSATAAFDYPTVNQLADHLDRLLRVDEIEPSSGDGSLAETRAEDTESAATSATQPPRPGDVDAQLTRLEALLNDAGREPDASGRR